ncbi:MAG: ATPase [Proteobacteria bacterium]|jgi:predicted Fe-Mo cluster-binding NifX family protein|nr:NifB/NifX family molybdenum-iron cluster-binding protein [Alphaproteobacteria bacterium]NCC04138.1 ATPase [Pseudomonadota bacterium]
MIIAIPVENGKLCSHFGHCLAFALIQIAADKKTIAARRDIDAPPHEPGLLPNWLFDRGVNLILCSGMGPRALELFAQKGIEVVTGAPVLMPEELVAVYLSGALKTNPNSCNH